MDLTLDTQIYQNDRTYTLVRLDGSLDHNSYEYFDECLRQLFEEQCFHIILDCNKLSFIGSGGFSSLIQFKESIEKENGRLVLMNLSSEVFAIFKILGFNEILTIYDSEEDFLHDKKE